MPRRWRLGCEGERYSNSGSGSSYHLPVPRKDCVYGEAKVVGIIYRPDIVEIRLSQPGITYKPGQWMLLNFPEAGAWRWHRFTAVSCPSDPYISAYLRLTCALPLAWCGIPMMAESRVKIYDQYGVEQMPKLRIGRPYSEPAERLLENHASVLIGIDFDVAPWMPVLEELRWNYRVLIQSNFQPRIDLLWICTHHGVVEIFKELLQSLEDPDISFLRIHIYITEKFDMDTACNIRLNTKIGAKDPLTELKTLSNFGNPDFNQLFRTLRDDVLDGTKGISEASIGVYFSGSPTMEKRVKNACHAAASPRTIFTLRTTTFYALGTDDIITRKWLMRLKPIKRPTEPSMENLHVMPVVGPNPGADLNFPWLERPNRHDEEEDDNGFCASRADDEFGGGQEAMREVMDTLLGVSVSLNLADLSPAAAEDMQDRLRLRVQNWGFTLEDVWKRLSDGEFNLGFTKRIEQLEIQPTTQTTAILCEHCSSLDLLAMDVHYSMVLSELRKTRISCNLCQILYESIERYGRRDQEIIEVHRVAPFLRLGGDGPAILRICADPGVATKAIIHDILPIPPVVGSSAHFELLRGWLRNCNETHKGYQCVAGSKTKLPTRVLDLGDNTNPPTVRLLCTEGRYRGEYIALSHCWGSPTAEAKEKFCTYRHNFDSRCTSIVTHQLPKTFQDAIRVTRELGKRYLWIDSLCIIQDDKDDWESESKRMMDVFHLAYCTIAASSAVDPTQGFLRPHQDTRYVRLPNPSDIPLYICDAVDDFHRDVENSRLNGRGWVLQETVLSRRIIHFAARQTYWECGYGIRCDTLARIFNPRRDFLCNPRFSTTLITYGATKRSDLFRFLFETYTTRQLTNHTDRALAISGLEKCLATAFKTDVRYGVFQKYLHGSLLWCRYGDTRMRRIPYPATQKVPSWSWMAYEGKISFERLSGAGTWSHTVQLLDDDTLKGMLRNLRRCTIEKADTECIILDENGNNRGWIIYDEDEDILDVQALGCIVIGAYDGTCRVLIVSKRVAEDSGVTYERVGLGSVQERLISREGQEVRVR